MDGISTVWSWKKLENHEHFVFYLLLKVSVSFEWRSFFIEMQGNQERGLKEDRNVYASAEDKTRRNLLANISPVRSLRSGLGEGELHFSPTSFSLLFSNTVSDLMETRPLCMKCNASCLIACTQTLFYFSFRSFRKHRRAKRACENERGARERKIKNYFLLLPPLPPCAGGQ